jgi:hypothetical protein
VSGGINVFRVGVRPNGKSYVHAGRYGLYYRQELSGPSKGPGHDPHDAPSEQFVAPLKGEPFVSAASSDLQPVDRKSFLTS